MDWQDEGILLTYTPFGERGQIASLFTEHHGRHRGLFKQMRQHSATLNPGALMAVRWHARLEDHLGLWQLEPLFSPLAWILHDVTAMHGLLSAISLIESIIPEREPHPHLYTFFKNLIHAFQQGHWLQHYILFELALIRQSGVPVSLAHCAVTGSQDNLVYVSPRTGRAVSKEAGLPYHDRLLSLPPFLLTHQAPTLGEALVALDLTEYFLKRYSLDVHGLNMPLARVQFKEKLKMQQRKNI